MNLSPTDLKFVFPAFSANPDVNKHSATYRHLSAFVRPYMPHSINPTPLHSALHDSSSQKRAHVRNSPTLLKSNSNLLKSSETLLEFPHSRRNLLHCCQQLNFYSLQKRKKDHKIKAPESRIDDLEQYSRIDDVIITGLVTTHQTYARATATKNTDNVNTDAEALQDELATLEDKVVKFFHSKGIDIEPNDISACRTLGTGTRNASSTQHRKPAPPCIFLR